jgi:hypothetical protein
MTRFHPTRLRVAIAPAIVLLLAASLFGVIHGVEHVNEHAVDSVAVSTADAPSHATLFVGHSKLTSSRIVAARPSRGSLVVTDALLLGAALAGAADLYRRRSDARLRDHLRVDAVFARRRGTPAVHLAR